MNESEDNVFFENIRRSVKVSHFVSSIIPLALLVYFSLKYVYPYVSHGDLSKVPIDIGILLLLAVTVSVLGLILTTRATNSSIRSARDLNIKLNSLVSITREFRETRHLDVLLTKIVEAAMELTSAGSGSLLLYNDKGRLEFNVNTGNTSEKLEKHSISSGEGFAGWVAESGEALMLNNAINDQRYNPDIDAMTGIKTDSILCVPLIYSTISIGAIELRNKQGSPFTQQDRALLQSMAGQASISIAQKRSSETQQSDLIHITEMLVNAQDYIQNKKGHARRVASYANMIGKKMDFSEPELKKLYHASLLHDIGMLKVDITDQNEKEKAMQHPRLGYDLVRAISLWGESADIILHHHERYDGTGYPMSKKEDEIPLSSRILSVADTLDKLTNTYSNEKKLDFDAAVIEIEADACSQFDPAVVQAMRESVTEAGLIQ